MPAPPRSQKQTTNKTMKRPSDRARKTVRQDISISATSEQEFGTDISGLGQSAWDYKFRIKQTTGISEKMVARPLSMLVWQSARLDAWRKRWPHAQDRAQSAGDTSHGGASTRPY